LALETKAQRLEDPGAEMLERATAVWDRFGRVILVAGAAVIVVAVGAWFLMKSRAQREEQAASALAEANILYWQGDYARSLERARQVSTQFESTPSGIEAHRLAGDNAFWNGDFKTAVAEYRRYLDKHKGDLLADAARRSLAYALESAGQLQEAAQQYEQLVGKFDRNSSAEFLSAAARCERLLNRPEEALKRLERVEREFGETSYGQSARIEIAELKAAAGR
jgi:tetratricopeptide (TPR) repeat protein